MTHKQKKANLVWLDLEMTGLDPARCTILEIATIATDGQLTILSEGPSLVIHHPPRVLATMEPWSRTQHAASGLTARAQASRVSLRQAEAQTLAWLKHWARPRTAPLCGNTIWQDRRFLVKYMPELEQYLHYRTIDVSSVKELVSRWYPNDHAMPRQKENTHRVADDIRESIDELKHYRKKVFVAHPKP